jgi:hypothetical protein
VVDTRHEYAGLEGICRQLKESGRHATRGWWGTRVRRTPAGGYVAETDDEVTRAP